MENRFVLRDHAAKRGDERLISRTHVVNVAKTLIESKWQETKQTHWFIGFLEDGQPGGFYCGYSTKEFGLSPFLNGS